MYPCPMNRRMFLVFLVLSSCVSLINYLGKGYEAYQKGDLEGAEQFFRKAVKKKPRDAIAHNNLGLVLLDLDRVEEAIPFLKLSTVLSKEPYGAPHINLARAYYEQGKLDLAKKSGEQGLALDAQNPVILLIMANIYCARNEKIPDAQSYARTATDKIADPDKASAWSTLAEAEYKLHNIESAMAAIDTAIALDTDNAFYRQQKALYKP